MDANSTIRLFLRQTVIRKSFPFEVVSSDPLYHPVNQAFSARAAHVNIHEHNLCVKYRSARDSRARVCRDVLASREHYGSNALFVGEL